MTKKGRELLKLIHDVLEMVEGPVPNDIRESLIFCYYAAMDDFLQDTWVKKFVKQLHGRRLLTQ